MSRDDVLLLGGTGFIGQALAKRLAMEHIRFHSLGRQNADLLEHVLPHCGTVVHLASGTTPGSSARHPSLELNTLSLTLRLLDLLHAQPETHLIFFSSGGAVYGNVDQLPINEDTPTCPLSNYGAGKVAKEAFCQAFRSECHPVTIVRPSNAYGPGQAMRSGFGLVRTMLELARCAMPLEIWGDGESVRDFIFVDDIIEATIRLIGLPQDSCTYNLGTGIGYSINQIVEIVKEISGVELATVYRTGRSSDVRSVILDNSRLNERLGWQPSIVLPDGIARTWKWLQQA